MFGTARLVFGLYTLPSAYPNAQDLTRLAGIGNSRFLDRPNLISFSLIFIRILIGFLIFGLSIIQAVRFSANTSIFDKNILFSYPNLHSSLLSYISSYRRILSRTIILFRDERKQS